MATLSIRIVDAARKLLTDETDISIRDAQTDVLDLQVRNIRDGLARIDLAFGSVYLLRVAPRHYRPVQQVVSMTGDRALEVCCPIDPAKVEHVIFPAYRELSERLQYVLGKSRVEGAEGVVAEALYQALTALQKAGLLNLYAKLARTRVGERPAWSYVQRLYRIRGDRIFAVVEPAFRDRVKDAVTTGAFHAVSSALHTPPAGFQQGGSFKSDDTYGSLQATFFVRTHPLEVRADLDLDDAGGIGHVFQVVRHGLTGGETHPYDIHEILLAHQALDPGYTLVV